VAISEIPDEWERAVARWAVLNRAHKRMVGKRLAPSRNDEYALYQTLVGVWPWDDPDHVALGALRERVSAYVLKAVREAKVHTSWVNPDADYEAAVAGFVAGALASGDDAFLRELAPLARKLARIGAWTSLAWIVLKIAAPGIPDFYQGNETWTLALVDPDNRRPVDFARRERTLEELAGLGRAEGNLGERVSELLARPGDGRIKTWVTSRGLGLRRELEPVFVHGSYEPLRCHGPRADHLCAFARRHEGRAVVAVAGRRLASGCDPERAAPVGADAWAETTIELPESLRVDFVDRLTGERVGPDVEGRLPAGGALARLPAALLVPVR
jgi:(1->4)-alpha-D-glucan 1-alpha-D-glucosylmutase